MAMEQFESSAITLTVLHVHEFLTFTENGYYISHIHSLLYNTQESSGIRVTLPCTHWPGKVSSLLSGKPEVM